MSEENEEISYDDCPECGAIDKLKCEDDPGDGIVNYICEKCGWKGYDLYTDLYGCMSVPWGGV